MLEKEIRESLKLYLHNQQEDIVFYEEMYIGNSRCDLLAVTDELIGYEIKSDGDNYKRLQRQVVDYNAFFDKNYVVVGDNHSLVESKIPGDWGIIVIGQNGIIVKRYAKGYINKTNKQLYLLWRVELINLMYRNNLVADNQMEKEALINRLLSCIDEAILKPQIVEELKMRDTTTAEIRGDGAVLIECESGIVDMLSEQNLENVTLDYWLSLYNRAKTIQKKKEKTALTYEKVEEMVIDAREINVSLGSVFVKPYMIDKFIYYLADEAMPTVLSDYRKTLYESHSNTWIIQEKNRFSRNNFRIYDEFGTPEHGALHLLDAILNGRETKGYVKRGNSRKEDKAKTLELLDKKQIIENEFKEWIHKDKQILYEIYLQYKKLFGDKIPKVQYDTPVTLRRLSPKFSLYDYQQEAVDKIINTDNTLLALDVGSGKTAIMIVAAMEMRLNGTSQKNMFVVPNSIVGQWHAMFLEIYPDAKVLAIEPSDFKPQTRTKVLQQIRENDYDAIIIAYSCFEMIRLSKGYIASTYNAEIMDISKSIKECNNYLIERKMRAAVDSIKKAIRAVSIRVEKEEGEFFDHLGITTLFVDEAHNFKNIPLLSNYKRIRGINATGSPKCTELLQKVRCIQEQNNGRGVIFATATPLCNSITDVFAMQSYLQYDLLKEKGLEKFDVWAKTFSKVESVLEIDMLSDKYRYVERFAKFYQLNKLSEMFGQIAVFYSKKRQMSCLIFSVIPIL